MNELNDYQVVNLSTALKVYAADLERRGCVALARETQEFRRLLLGSRVYVEPFKSFHHAEI